MTYRKRAPVPYGTVVILHEGHAVHLPVRRVRIPARLADPDWSVWTYHQVVYAPGMLPAEIKRAASLVGLSAALSWLVSNSAMLAKGAP